MDDVRFWSVVALAVALAALAVALMALHRVRLTSGALATFLAADRPPLDDVDWQLEWIEPGVYFLTSTSTGAPALQVEVRSLLVPVSGGPPTTATVRADRVNPGAWMEVRHPAISQDVFDDLEQLRRSAAVVDELRRRPTALDTSDLTIMATTEEEINKLRDRVEYALTYTVSWRSEGGALRLKTSPEQRLVPSPMDV